MAVGPGPGPGPGPNPGPAPAGTEQIVLVGGTRSTNYPTTAGAVATSYRGGIADGMVSSVRLSGSTAVQTFSTFFGGSGSEEIRDAFVDGQGNIYITGITDSPNMPTTVGAFQRVIGGGNDGFVAKLSPTGQLLASTFLGGGATDQGYTIAVDSAGFIYVAGRTASADFPVTPGAFRGPGTYGGGQFDMMIAKLQPDLSAIVWATYLGGSGFDSVRGRLALDAAGNVYVSGNTESINFPGAVGVLIGQKDSVVAKISANGSQLVYARLIGGHDSQQEVETFNGGLVVTPGGEAYACGFSSALDIPNAIRPYGGGVLDSVIARLSPTGQVLAVTYLGGNGRDECEGIALDASGNVVVSTMTDSSNFPTTAGVFQTSSAGGRDLAITKLSPNLSQILFSTYVGGAGDEFGDTVRVELDAAANIYFAGYTTTTGIPWITANAVQPTYRGGTHDMLFVVLSADGRQVLYASYLGGNDFEICRSLRYRRN